MISHEATAIYSEPIVNGRDRLAIDLFPAIPTKFGLTHRAMVVHFDMHETNEISGLTSLRAVSDLDSFLAFFGSTWEEALARWTTLSSFDRYRSTSSKYSYASLDAWERFYEYLESGIKPVRMEVAFLEHY